MYCLCVAMGLVVYSSCVAGFGGDECIVCVL